MIDDTHLRRVGELLRRQPVVRALVEAAGRVPVHLVGGVLRDRLLGLPGKDVDAVVATSGAAIAGRVASRLGATVVHLGGRAFAAYRVVGEIAGEGFVLDVWDRESVPLERDLARRDFTVNAFALDLANGRIVDPLGGVPDLGHRTLRAATPESFAGDPLRVLRLPRLLVQLPGFAAEPGTLALARASAARLVEVAAERVREELVLLFKADDAARALALLAALDVYPGLWLGRPGVADGTGGAVAEIAHLPAAAAAVRALVRDAEIDLLAARFGAAFAHLPAPPSPATEPDPARRAVVAVERFRTAGYLTARLAARVLPLATVEPVPPGERERRSWLARLGEPLWPTALAVLGARSATRWVAWRRAAGELASLVAADGGAILSPPRLLSGGDVQELLGIDAGPRVGEALAAVRAAQVEGRVRTRDEAAALLRKATVQRSSGSAP